MRDDISVTRGPSSPVDQTTISLSSHLHKSSISSPSSPSQSCFWTILSSETLSVLHISPSLKLQLCKQNLTPANIVSRRFLDLFDPSDVEAMYTDLNGFHLIRAQLQACVFRWKLLDFSFLHHHKPPSSSYLNQLRKDNSRPYFVEADVTLVSMVDYILVLVHCKDSCTDTCDMIPSQLQCDLTTISASISPSSKTYRSMQIYNIDDLSLIAAFPSNFLSKLIGVELHNDDLEGLAFFQRFMDSQDYYAFKGALEQSSRSPPRKPGQICTHKSFHFRYRLRPRNQSDEATPAVLVEGLFLFYHNLLFAISDVERSCMVMPPFLSSVINILPTTSSVSPVSETVSIPASKPSISAPYSVQTSAEIGNMNAPNIPELERSSRPSSASGPSVDVVTYRGSPTPYSHPPALAADGVNDSRSDEVSFDGSRRTSIPGNAATYSGHDSIRTSMAPSPYVYGIRANRPHDSAPSMMTQAFEPYAPYSSSYGYANEMSHNRPPFPPSTYRPLPEPTSTAPYLHHSHRPPLSALPVANVSYSISVPHNPAPLNPPPIPISQHVRPLPHPVESITSPMHVRIEQPSFPYPHQSPVSGPHSHPPPVYHHPHSYGPYPPDPSTYHPSIPGPYPGYPRHPYLYSPYPRSTNDIRSGLYGHLSHQSEPIDTQTDKSARPPEKLNLLGLTRKKITPKRKCENCGTTDSPEWRRGPNGHKTLCNACGLRYARILNKRKEIPKLTLNPPETNSGTSDAISPQLPTGTGSHGSTGSSLKVAFEEIVVSDSATPSSAAGLTPGSGNTSGATSRAE